MNTVTEQNSCTKLPDRNHVQRSVQDRDNMFSQKCDESQKLSSLVLKLLTSCKAASAPLFWKVSDAIVRRIASPVAMDASIACWYGRLGEARTSVCVVEVISGKKI